MDGKTRVGRHGVEIELLKSLGVPWEHCSRAVITMDVKEGITVIATYKEVWPSADIVRKFNVIAVEKHEN